MMETIYLWELNESGGIQTEVIFPMTPQEIRARFGAKFLTYDILDLGTVQFPSGNEPDEVSWEAMLPGAARQGLSVVHHWKDPWEIERQLLTWKRAGTKLYLMVTGSSIAINMSIQSYEPTYAGGHGDIQYSISFVQAVDLKITTVSTQPPQTPQTSNRPQNQTAKTYTVKSGDSLWIIAKKTLGNGARYMEIFKLNKKPAGPLKNPNDLKPGQVLKLP